MAERLALAAASSGRRLWRLQSGRVLPEVSEAHVLHQPGGRSREVAEDRQLPRYLLEEALRPRHAVERARGQPARYGLARPGVRVCPTNPSEDRPPRVGAVGAKGGQPSTQSRDAVP